MKEENLSENLKKVAWENKKAKNIELQEERMGSHLYNARTAEGQRAEGEYNEKIEAMKEQRQKIRNIEKELENEPGFIGLGIFGSLPKGYFITKTEDHSDEPSDIDLLIFCDSPLRRKYIAYKEKPIADVAAELAKKLKYKMHFWPIPIDLNRFREEINRFVDPSSFRATEYVPAYVSRLIAELSVVVTGKKVNEYRNQIAEILNRLSQEKREEIVKVVIFILKDADRQPSSIHKQKKRIHTISHTGHEKILDKRVELWRKRVKKIWVLK